MQGDEATMQGDEASDLERKIVSLWHMLKPGSPVTPPCEDIIDAASEALKRRCVIEVQQDDARTRVEAPTVGEVMRLKAAMEQPLEVVFDPLPPEQLEAMRAELRAGDVRGQRVQIVGGPAGGLEVTGFTVGRRPDAPTVVEGWCELAEAASPVVGHAPPSAVKELYGYTYADGAKPDPPTVVEG